jgi:NitT/TauT family transport system substrate-binding protein
MLGGCLSRGNDTGGTVELLLNWTPSGLHVPYYAAAERGYYENEDISLSSIKDGQGSDFSAQQVGLGNEDFGITSGDQLLNINTRELSPVSVGVIMQRTPVVLFTARDQFGRELTDPAQLSGKTVGSGPGMVRLTTRSYLEHHGVWESAEYVDSGFDTVQQLLTGQIDAAGGVFGDVVDARLQGATIDVLEVNETVPSYGHVISTHDGMIEDNPEVVRGFLRATARGSAWAHNNPSEATGVLTDAVPELAEVRENQLRKWEQLASNYILSGTVSAEGWAWSRSEPWQQTYELLEAGEMLDGSIDPDDVWTNEFLDTDYEYIGEYTSQIDDPEAP